MDFEYTVKKVSDIKFIQVKAGARYFEDSKLNGVDDKEKLMPFIKGEFWCPTIELETGVILNWSKGPASIHYKVCDNGVYELLDKDHNVCKSYSGYVPRLLSPEGEGYGDYIIMEIDANGLIKDWRSSLECFEDYENFAD